MNKRKNIPESLKLTTMGFTLVELLAVIVILAIILVIAVPKVMTIIEDSKKATLETTAKMIASLAEKAKVQNTILGNETTITCESVAKINKIDYDTCNIKFEDNTVKVTIIGKGKFTGLNVCSGTKTNAEANNEDCELFITALNFEKTLCTDDATCTANNLLKDVDGNIRYYGANPNNYIEFNNEVWRIIGVFDVASEVDGETQKRIKIVREEFLKDKILYNEENNLFLNSYIKDYLNNDTQGNYYYSLDPNAKNKIETAVWNTGTLKMSTDGYTPQDIYNVEKLTQNIESIIGLISVSDYGYAGGSSCTSVADDTCGTNNWMLKSGWYWTITPNRANSIGIYRIYDETAGVVASTITGNVRPVVYLREEAILTGTGENTPEGIYKIS